MGAEVRKARAYYAEVIQSIQGDVEQYRFLMEEYTNSPKLLVDRLWQQTKERVLTNRGVTKYYLSPGQKEIRLRIGEDPEEQRQQEREQYMKEEGAELEEKVGDFNVEDSVEEDQANSSRSM